MEMVHPSIIIDSLDNGFFMLDENFTVLGWNKWMELKTGILKDQIINNHLQTFFPELDYKTMQRKINTALILGSSTFYDHLNSKPFMYLKRFKVTDKSAEYMHLNVVISPWIGKYKIVMISIYDVSELHDLHKALQNEMEVVQSLYQELERDKVMMDATLMMVKTDLNGLIMDISDAKCAFLGYTKSELIGHKSSIFRNPKMPSSLFSELWESINKGIAWRGEVSNIAKDGTSHWLELTIIPVVDNDTLLYYIGIYNDIQDKKKIEKLAITDPLTKLYNRGYFDKLFDKSIHNTKRSNDNLSLIIIDIDHFKAVNDTYGHQKGDMVLTHIAATLKETLRDNDLLARWGGEEFGILLNCDITNATFVAEKLRVGVEKLIIPDIKNITCSFGMTGYQKDDTAISMFKRADEALYIAKQNGRNRVEQQ